MFQRCSSTKIWRFETKCRAAFRPVQQGSANYSPQAKSGFFALYNGWGENQKKNT